MKESVKEKFERLYEPNRQPPYTSQQDVFKIIMKYTDKDIITASEHDMVYLLDDPEILSDITDEDVIKLISGGVMYSSIYDCLDMFI